MLFRAFALSALCLGVAAVAQAPTVNASVTSALTAEAYGSPPAQQIVPIGPLSAGGASLSVTALGGSASMVWAPTGGLPSGVAGFDVGAFGYGLPGLLSSSGFSNDGEVVLQLSMAAPTPVLVLVEGTVQATGCSSSTQVDIDNDALVEVSLLASTFFPAATVREQFGLLVGPAGRAIRIAHSSSGFWTGLSLPPAATSDLQITVYAGAYPVASYGPGCMPLTWTRDAVGAATFHCPASSFAAFAVGLDPVQVPLAIAPGCYQLTDVLFAVVALPNNGQASYALPLPLLPPGFEVRVQAASVDAAGAVLTSNGALLTSPI